MSEVMIPHMASAITLVRPHLSLSLPHHPVVSAESTPCVMVIAVDRKTAKRGHVVSGSVDPKAKTEAID